MEQAAGFLRNNIAKGESMSDLFGDKAEEWDANDTIRRLSSAVGAAIVDNIPLHSQMDVMDFGAGTGLISSHIAPFVNRIVAVDVSQAMLDKLAAKRDLQGKVEAICRDIIASPLEARFDLIVSAMALHHIKDTREAIRVLSSHLKPGGILALADLDSEEGDFHPPGTEGIYHFGFERRELGSLLKQEGFDSIRFITAHTIERNEKLYPVFLVVAQKQIPA